MENKESPRAEDFMRQALAMAREAAARGEVPVGAVVVRENMVIGKGFNQTETTGDPTAHAEIMAIRQAAATLGDWRLSGCTLFSTLEPCPMCFGAAGQARVQAVVFGAFEPPSGAQNRHADEEGPPCYGGLLEEEASALLREAFKKRRIALQTSQ